MRSTFAEIKKPSWNFYPKIVWVIFRPKARACAGFYSSDIVVIEL